MVDWLWLLVAAFGGFAVGILVAGALYDGARADERAERDFQNLRGGDSQ